MNVAELIRDQATRRSDAEALRAFGPRRSRSLSFVELDRAGARFGDRLRRSGLVPGDTVLLLQPTSPELYVALLGIARAGLVAIVPDPAAPGRGLEQCLAGAPKAVIARTAALRVAPFSRPLRAAGTRIPLDGVDRSLAGSGLPAIEDIEPRSPDAPLLLTLTSGSTGPPKLVARTHGILAAQHEILSANLGDRLGEAVLTTLPFVALGSLASGVTTVIPDGPQRLPDARALLGQLDSVHSLAASPGLLEWLADHCRRRGLRLGVKSILVGGASVWPRLLDQLGEVAPQAETVVIYGSTEAEPICVLWDGDIEPEDVRRMHGGGGLLLGRPVPEARLEILDGGANGAGGHAQPVRPWLIPRTVGEVAVSGPHVVRDGARSVVNEGISWHRTGDAGYLDGAGRLWLLGRSSSMIRDGRGLLYPLSVEGALSCHDEISRSAVVIVDGRRVLAVQPSRPMPPRRLDAILESVKWAEVDEVVVLASIPTDRRHEAKVDYPALARMLGAARAPALARLPPFG